VIPNFFFLLFKTLSVQIPLQPRASPSRQPSVASDVIGWTETTNYSLTRQATRNSSRTNIKRKFFLL